VRWITVLFAFCSAVANATLSIEQKTDYYTVSTDALASLLSTVNAASPIRQNGEVYHGYTKYHIEWSFWPQGNSHRCKIVRLKTTLSIVFTLPQLKSENEEVHAVWRLWFPNLLRHEEKHAALAAKYAKKIDEQLAAMGTFTSCDKLKFEANQLGFALLNALNDANAVYDNETNHGESENAWLYKHL